MARYKPPVDSYEEEHTVDFDSILEKDEQETRYDKVIKHRKKLKLRRKRVKVLLILLFVICVGAYMFSSLSDVKIIKVKNNVIYSQQQILDKAGVQYNDKLILHPAFFMERALESDELIKSVTIHKNYISGAIYIDVQEEKVIGYYQEGEGKYVLLENGKTIEMTSTKLSLISSPFIVNLDEEQRSLLAKKLSDIEQADIGLISEVRHYETSYDNNMLELLMQDGHIVRTSFDGLKLLVDYRKILENVKSNLRCINFVESADPNYNSSYANDCSE